MFKDIIGMRVRITTDCRDGADASGTFGIYEGDFIFGDMDSTVPPDAAITDHWTNPRIRLDNGDVIWGAQCWWEPVVDNMPTLDESMAHVKQVVTGFKELLEHMKEDDD